VSLHLQRFAKQNIDGKSRGYLIALAIACQEVGNKGRLSEKIRDRVNELGPAILDLDIQRRRRHYIRFLNRDAIDGPTIPALAKTIDALRVKGFRGFGTYPGDDCGSLIEFNPRKNILFAPNGGGKTSLCEALEYVFTGGIKEAERRRTKITDYVRRGEQKHIAKVRMSDGNIFSGTAPIDSCFIDRNRLQEFSLLGSKDTNFQERDVLAALFGLEEIEELISRFVLPKSFVLANCKRTTVKIEMDRLSQAMQQARGIRFKALADIGICRQSIASNLGITSYQKDLVVNRLDFKKKYLQFKREKLTSRKLIEAPIAFSARVVAIYEARIGRAIDKLFSEQQQLLSALDGVSFEDLFNAILDDPNASDAEACPACLTPLSEVVVNPYKRAANEIKKLSRLAELRERVQELKDEIVRFDQKCRVLRNTLNINTQRGVAINADLAEIVNLLERIPSVLVTEKVPLWRDLFSRAKKFFPLIQAYESDCIAAIRQRSAPARDAEARTAISRMETEIEDIGFQMRTIKERRAEIVEVAPTLAGFKTAASNVNERLALEEEYNRLVDEIEAEYKNLHDDLRKYKLGVEDSQVAGIEGKAVDFYKKINYGDDDCEKVVGIKFIRSDNGYRIELELLNADRCDAFSLLSEGHLRALGLSLLLAVAYQKRYPFIVFDDVVNAIDSDHRANIIELLHEDDYLSSIQQIITTHDRLFWERYCNNCKSKFGEHSLSSKTLRNTSHGITLIDYGGGFKHKIEKALENFDVRQALIYCRIWFETLVVEYCTNKNLTVTASFSKHQLKPSNYLTISLESTYTLISEHLAWDLSNVNILRTDLINWQAQNQAHHAFDERTLNIVHAKTSGEVKRIFDALVRFAYQLCPADWAREIAKEKAALEQRLVAVRRNLDNQAFVANAPGKVVDGYRASAALLPTQIGALELDLQYIAVCIESTIPQ
jgi:DNA sulfur modification protein DndD